jgi:hypothetical protein
MPRGKKTSHDLSPDQEPEEQGDTMAVTDERAEQSAYITAAGRHFRALYNPEVHDPRWFVRSFMVGPDGSPVDVQDYPERFFEEQEAWEGARREAEAADRA